jgi:hypothetical protein
VIGGLAALVPARRSAEDIFAGRIRVDLGGQTYTMPVLSRRANREWLESLDASFASLLTSLEDIDDGDEVLRLLFSATDEFLDALVSYDQSAVLPPRASIDDDATDLEIIRAVMEVWRAANPLVAIALGLAPSAEPGSPTSTPTPPESTAGRPASSRKS